jgi:hypothetical protein
MLRPFRSSEIMVTDTSFEICRHSDVKMPVQILHHVDPSHDSGWLRGRDLNPRPSGYEPDSIALTKLTLWNSGLYSGHFTL